MANNLGYQPETKITEPPASIPDEISVGDKTVEFNCSFVGEYAMDAVLSGKVLAPGRVSQAVFGFDYIGIDSVLLTVRKRNENGTYSDLVKDVAVALPSPGDAVVTAGLGGGFTAVPGSTYVFSFVGYAGGVPVCRDDCYAVCGYE